MSILITALIVLIVVGLLCWVADRAPFDPAIRWAIQVVAVIVGVLWLIKAAGIG